MKKHKRLMQSLRDINTNARVMQERIEWNRFMASLNGSSKRAVNRGNLKPVRLDGKIVLCPVNGAE